MMKEVVNNMKKLWIILSILTFMFVLVGCNNDKVEDLEITIKTEEVLSDKINIDVVVPINVKDIEAIEEIAYNIASQIYEKHFDEIGTSSYLLTIKLYDSTQSFDAKENTYGMITFDINKAMDQPGLQLNTNNLKTK